MWEKLLIPTHPNLLLFIERFFLFFSSQKGYINNNNYNKNNYNLTINGLNYYHGETTKEEMRLTTKAVKKQVLDDIIDLCAANKELVKNDKAFEIEDEKCLEIRDRFALLFGKFNDEIELTRELAQNIQYIWKQIKKKKKLHLYEYTLQKKKKKKTKKNAMKKTWKIRSKAHIMESTPFFLDRVLAISAPDYSADFEDHVTTLFICRPSWILHDSFPSVFEKQKWVIKVTDVGGQRNLNAVLYVMSLNGYDEVLFEDNTRNSWDESFQLFGDLASLKEFQKTSFITFLNKAGVLSHFFYFTYLYLFQEKIKEVSFTTYYEKCPTTEVHNPDYAINFCKEELIRRFTVVSLKTYCAHYNIKQLNINYKLPELFDFTCKANDAKSSQLHFCQILLQNNIISLFFYTLQRLFLSHPNLTKKTFSTMELLDIRINILPKRLACHYNNKKIHIVVNKNKIRQTKPEIEKTKILEKINKK
ncbi:hypothetical protein RFI_19141 [Reticulomyxa filosa]|uniref:Uncharacterized protein n=1 Tax=Reticulomyxa filosa TaxID=46433 RepID=X6MXD8_RETFI|nr:hypothetical protein RFI_19141 [Reticulomyxa filosa]|eukprot:ETO18147.1 hypothetical protein RFI_19141 [Reticulomyxa filosa]